MGQRVSRRQFGITASQAVAGGALLGTLAPGCGGGSGSPTGDPAGPEGPAEVAIDLADPAWAALARPGGAVAVAAGGSLPVIVSHLDDDSYVAFSSSCTHRGCQVGLPSASGVIRCPCHGSRYDRAGRVTGGPATRDLPRVALARDGDRLTLSP